MTSHFPGEIDDVLLNRKEASRELATLGIRRAPSTLAKIFCTRSDGPPCTHLGRTPYYPRRKLHEWAKSQLTDLRSSSSQPRRQRGWSNDARD
jgi:hypothetical protein